MCIYCNIGNAKHRDVVYSRRKRAMSRLEGIENQEKQLTAEELREFRDWFGEFEADA
jgi:hypothetical protein